MAKWFERVGWRQRIGGAFGAVYVPIERFDGR
jgi:hypothetical protein